MAGQVFLPNGTTVTFNSIDIGGLTGITLPDESKGSVESTTNDSSRQRTFIPGLKDGGTFQLQGRLIPGDVGQAACRTNYAANVTQECVITLPLAANDDGSTVTTYTFDAFVTALGGDLPQDADESATWTCSMKVAGAVTEASA